AAPDAAPASDSGAASVPGATEPNLKVAFVADTNAGSSYAEVLDLIKREGTDLVVFQGGLTYAPTTAGQWLSVTDGARGDVATYLPYSLGRGNHGGHWKTSWSGLAARGGKGGVPPEGNAPPPWHYAIGHTGLKIVIVDDTETSSPTRNEYLKERL